MKTFMLYNNSRKQMTEELKRLRISGIALKMLKHKCLKGLLKVVELLH